MILLFSLLGLLFGWLMEMVGDYLLRFSNVPLRHQGFMLRWPAVLTSMLDGKVIDLRFELFIAGLFALLYAVHGLSPETLWLMGICSFFALIALMDYKYHIILNILTYPGLGIALVANIILLRQPVLNVLLGIVFGFGVFYLTARVKPGGVGGGDLKLAALIGAGLGFPNILWALIVAVAASAVTIVFLLLTRRSTPKDSIPYAPFLSLGVMVVLIWLFR